MTTTATTRQRGTCACGATVERDVPDRFAAFFATTPFVCQPCIEAAEAQEARDAARFRRDAEIRREQARLHASGLPARWADTRLDEQPGVDQAKAVAAAWGWVNGATRGLLLCGPVGVGKTHIAAAACRTLIAAGGTARWVSAPLLFARLGAGLGSDTRDQAIELLTSRHPLVLDDIDKSRPTEYGAEHVFLAVDSRVTNDIPLIVTTNLSLGELALRWPAPHGEAIASRLAGYCRRVDISGPDRRIR